ncbi:MAG TPA: site-2 protease family protein [Myxococcaceae bacterium]
MFRFRIGSIPVHIHFFHLLLSGLFGLFLFLPRLRLLGPPWLGDRLADSSASGYQPAMAVGVLAWMLILAVILIVYELGHAVTLRVYGHQPQIDLVSFGGQTTSDATGPMVWYRNVAVSLAAPFATLVLGGVSGAAYFLLKGQWLALDFFLYWFFVVSLFWTLFNLLPLPPLDGGKVLLAVLSHFLGRTGIILTHGLALLVAAAAVAWSLRSGGYFIAVLFGLWGFQSLRAISEALRASSPPPEELAPLLRQLEHAQQALAHGELEEARRRATTVLESDGPLTPELASRAHHALGWVALKQGQGRMALDHFSQVQREPVEAQALAAAFSLIGDETRALPLWEKAWGDTGNRTVMHEYAGSLIRAGKVSQALKLPEVDPAAAFSCAESTLFIRGAYAEAGALGEAALAHVPSPTVAYDAACAFARAQNVADALRLLHRAKELGYRNAEAAASDEDLAPLRRHPEFEAWLAALRQSAPS